MVEFALVLPLLAAIAMTGIEYANLAMAHVRISQIADTVADNAGRVPDLVTETDIDEIFAGARETGGSLDFEANGKVVLSSLQQNGQPAPKTGETDNRGQWIRWQRCLGALKVNPAYGVEGTGESSAALQSMGKTGRTISALPHTAVMFVEVSYDYQPIVSSALVKSTRIQYESAFIVRDRAELGIQSGTTSYNCPTY
ncbi:TadE/TadG family type IV pilus assembly protein [Allosphingosinicella deserti]|nr:TadE/TadG family type IV pilus assembly protein [Sphingomonas deserti]